MAKKMVYFLALSTLLAACNSSGRAPVAVTQPRHSVLMFGDCIRIRYEQETRRALGDDWNVWSQGPRNNLNMGQTLSDLGFSFGLDYDYDVVTLGTGIWDETLYGGHTPDSPATYKASVQTFIDSIHDVNPATVVMLVEVINCDLNQYCQPGLSAQYNVKLKELATENPGTVRIAPLYEWQQQYNLKQIDGMHFDQASSEIIGELLAQSIRNALS